MIGHRQKNENNEFTIKVTYNGVEYPFEYGSQAYIFHTGLYNDIHKKYGIKGLLEYVALVHDCYISDDNRTPLGGLADYVAARWKKIKKKDRSEILNEFYSYV